MSLFVSPRASGGVRLTVTPGLGWDCELDLDLTEAAELLADLAAAIGTAGLPVEGDGIEAGPCPGCGVTRRWVADAHACHPPTRPEKPQDARAAAVEAPVETCPRCDWPASDCACGWWGEP